MVLLLGNDRDGREKLLKEDAKASFFVCRASICDDHIAAGQEGQYNEIKKEKNAPACGFERNRKVSALRNGGKV